MLIYFTESNIVIGVRLILFKEDTYNRFLTIIVIDIILTLRNWRYERQQNTKLV